jgi:hypothetical protein
MPNTLAHIGINGLLTRTFIKQSDLIFIYFGTIIPDIPWIFQRILPLLFSDVNTYDLRLYCIVLASLFSSVILSIAFANIFSDTRRTFLIFSIGSLLHLLIDSIETKWANGVHLFAPFTWQLYNAGFFWPESTLIYSLTAFGILFVLWNWKQALSTSLQFSFKRSKLVFSTLFLLIYLFLPFLFLNSVEAANNHFVKTLREYENRPGKYFEVDRGKYIDNEEGDKFLTSFNEELKIVNLNLSKSENMSIRGEFVSPDAIRILDYHAHANRDLFSYVGLLIILVSVVITIVNKFKYKNYEV